VDGRIMVFVLEEDRKYSVGTIPHAQVESGDVSRIYSQQIG
jgi:hypothetical protein